MKELPDGRVLLELKTPWSDGTASRGGGGGERQLRDVRGILAAHANLDHAYLDEWANDLGVNDLLDQVRS